MKNNYISYIEAVKADAIINDRKSALRSDSLNILTTNPIVVSIEGTLVKTSWIISTYNIRDAKGHYYFGNLRWRRNKDGQVV